MADFRESVTQGHELRDAHAGAIVRVAGVSAVLGLAMLVGVAAMHRWLKAASPASDETPVHALPAEPRLQHDPQADLQRYLTEESKLLGSYGWVERSQGRVHIPIERAMERYATGR